MPTVSICRWIGIVDRRALGHRKTVSTRPRRRDHALQFSFEPGRPQSCPSHRRRMFDGAQARPQDPPLTSLLLAEGSSKRDGRMVDFNAVLLSESRFRGSLVTDERIKLISFTGSAAVGWEIKNNAGKKSRPSNWEATRATIVHGDPHLAYAADRCVTGVLLTPDSPVFPCSAFSWSTPSMENSPSCCSRQ